MLIVVANIKGGCGKTTVATNLAIIKATHRSDILLIDTDTQGSASEFFRVREEENSKPHITCISIADKGIVHQLVHLLPKYDDIIIDIGGRDSDTLRALLMFNKVDKLVIPVLASQVDIWTLQDFYSLIVDALEVNNALKVIPFINKKDANPKINLADKAKELINKEMPKIKIANSCLGDRISYRRAFAEGLSVIELINKDIKANLEINQLYQEVFHEA